MEIVKFIVFNVILPFFAGYGILQFLADWAKKGGGEMDTNLIVMIVGFLILGGAVVWSELRRRRGRGRDKFARRVDNIAERSEWIEKEFRSVHAALESRVEKLSDVVQGYTQRIGPLRAFKPGLKQRTKALENAMAGVVSVEKGRGGLHPEVYEDMEWGVVHEEGLKDDA